jgi:hypothetical protein
MESDMMDKVDNKRIRGSLKIRIGSKETWLLRREQKRRNGKSRAVAPTDMVFKKDDGVFKEVKGDRKRI